MIPTYTRWWLVGWTRLGLQGHHSLSARGRRYAKSPKAYARAKAAQENDTNRTPDAHVVEVTPNVIYDMHIPVWLYDVFIAKGVTAGGVSIVKYIREYKLERLVKIVETDNTFKLRGKSASMMIIDDIDEEMAKPSSEYVDTEVVETCPPDYAGAVRDGFLAPLSVAKPPTVVEVGQTNKCARCPEPDKCLIMGRCLREDERQAYFDKYGKWPESETPKDESEFGPDKFPWFATAENQECQIVKPRQTIMGNWLLVRNRAGVEWYVPFPELKPNPNP